MRKIVISAYLLTSINLYGEEAVNRASEGGDIAFYIDPIFSDHISQACDGQAILLRDGTRLCGKLSLVPDAYYVFGDVKLDEAKVVAILFSPDTNKITVVTNDAFEFTGPVPLGKLSFQETAKEPEQPSHTIELEPKEIKWIILNPKAAQESPVREKIFSIEHQKQESVPKEPVSLADGVGNRVSPRLFEYTEDFDSFTEIAFDDSPKTGIENRKEDIAELSPQEMHSQEKSQPTADSTPQPEAEKKSPVADNAFGHHVPERLFNAEETFESLTEIAFSEPEPVKERELDNIAYMEMSKAGITLPLEDESQDFDALTKYIEDGTIAQQNVPIQQETAPIQQEIPNLPIQQNAPIENRENHAVHRSKPTKSSDKLRMVFIAPENPEEYGFYIDKNMVTNEEYARFVKASHYHPPASWTAGEIPRGQENQPVVDVSYVDALVYAVWNGRQLPTAEQWKRAASKISIADSTQTPYYEWTSSNASEPHVEDKVIVGDSHLPPHPPMRNSAFDGTTGFRCVID